MTATKEKKPWKTGASSGHITNIKQSIFVFRYLWFNYNEYEKSIVQKLREKRWCSFPVWNKKSKSDLINVKSEREKTRKRNKSCKKIKNLFLPKKCQSLTSLPSRTYTIKVISLLLILWQNKLERLLLLIISAMSILVLGKIMAFSWAQCYKSFYRRNLWIFIIS